MPNAVTLMSEYCPDKRRAMITNAMFCGFPLGAAFGGFLAAWMIPHFGWRSVLYLGGIAPLLLVVLLVLVLPESVRYMVARGAAPQRIRQALAALPATPWPTSQQFVTDRAQARCPGPTRHRRGAVALVLRWARSCCGWPTSWGWSIFYALMNWMPVLFKEGGLDPQDGHPGGGAVPAGRRGRGVLRLADGPLRGQPHHRHRLCADGGVHLVDWPGGR